MLITLPSIKALAFIAVFARYAAAQATPTTGVIAATLVPSDTPDFQYQFKIDFSGGQCTQLQQKYIESALKNIGALAYRGGLWQTTPFRDWTPEVNYWFGNFADNHAAWIKNNFLRLFTAVTQGKSAYIDTYVYVGCNYDWSISWIGCTPDNPIFNFNNRYGWFWRWDNIYWNFCPNFFLLPQIPAMIKNTIDDPNKNIKFMENYYGTQEQWLFPGLLSIRSIGIYQMIVTYAACIQSPGDTRAISYQANNIQTTLVNFMSYFYTLMSITIPEAFNYGARPVTSEEWTASIMSNSNGTIIPPADNSSAAAQNSARTETYNTGSATTSSPPSISVVDLATISNATFSSLTDPAHANTENCFTFLPSISVQGTPSELCDCGSTTAVLTTHGSTTGCALSQTIFGVDQFPTGTATVAPAPMITSAPPTPTRAFEIMFKDSTLNGINEDAWTAYSHPIGQASKINACNGGFWGSSASGPALSYPTSLGPFTGNTYSGCRYQGPSTAPGSVTCSDLPQWTDCSTATATTQLCYNGDGYDNFFPQVECEF